MSSVSVDNDSPVRPDLYIYMCVSCQVWHVAHSRSCYCRGNTLFLIPSQLGLSGSRLVVHSACKTHSTELGNIAALVSAFGLKLNPVTPHSA